MKIVSENEVNLVLAFKGTLDTNGSDSIAHWFYGLLNDIKKNVVIDFSGVTYLSSAGIRLLLSGTKLTLKNDFKLYISEPIPDVLKIIRMAGLEQLLLFTSIP